MDAIVAVYADWGIGAKGTQPLVIPADRRRFRELTMGAAGRKAAARPRKLCALAPEHHDRGRAGGAFPGRGRGRRRAARALLRHRRRQCVPPDVPPHDVRIRHKNRRCAPLGRVFPGSGRRPRMALRIRRAARGARRRGLSVLRVRKNRSIKIRRFPESESGGSFLRSPGEYRE